MYAQPTTHHHLIHAATNEQQHQEDYSSDNQSTSSTPSSAVSHRMSPGLFDEMSPTSSTTSSISAKINNNKRSLKSLCLVSQEFLKIYQQKLDEQNAQFLLIEMKEAADLLLTPKRRLYDIFNIMSCVGILSKYGVSKFRFHGTKKVRPTLFRLQQEALDDGSLREGIRKLLEEREDDLPNFQESLKHFRAQEGSTELDTKATSLAMLSKRLIQLFLVTLESQNTYQDAIEVLLPGSKSSSSKRCGILVTFLIHTISL